MTNDIGTLAFTLLAGLLLGGVFYGGLWWTVQRGLSTTRPAVLFLTSMVVRTALALTGFYVASQGQWQRLLLCLAGFLVARIIITRYLRPSTANQTETPQKI